MPNSNTPTLITAVSNSGSCSPIERASIERKSEPLDLIKHGIAPRSKKPIFLMAEDNPADAAIFTEMIRQAYDNNASVIVVSRFEHAVEALESGRFEALILDMDLPDQSGIENVHQLGNQYPALPIVVLTGHDDIDLALNSLQSGAQDYLSKNKVSADVLARSLHYAKERKTIELKLKNALKDAAFKNIQLEALAKHDPLTGLANRSYFQDVAERILMRAQRSRTKVALMYFDLNEFKKINDTFGHLVGDDLLRQVSSRLKDVVRDSDFLARLGGDEFVIITDTLRDRHEAYPLVKRIQDQFDDEFEIDTHRISTSTSIGVAFFPEANSLDALIKQADCAMYEAKSNPKSHIMFYSGQIADQYARTQEIESCLGQGQVKGQFNAQFQPIVSVKNPNEIYLEALARWNIPELNNVATEDFISIAENSPAINQITQSVTQDAYHLFSTLANNQCHLGRVSINVSAKQITHDHFSYNFLNWLRRADLSPEKVCIELTERQVVHNTQLCKQHFKRLKQAGISLALDDFGSGVSSIGHLLDFSFDYLKLDRALISKIDTHTRNQALVAGIVEMAHRLNIEVVAEGIETSEEQTKAIELGCDYLQGFLIAKPKSVEDVVKFYKQSA